MIFIPINQLHTNQTAPSIENCCSCKPNFNHSFPCTYSCTNDQCMWITPEHSRQLCIIIVWLVQWWTLPLIQACSRFDDSVLDDRRLPGQCQVVQDQIQWSTARCHAVSLNNGSSPWNKGATLVLRAWYDMIYTIFTCSKKLPKGTKQKIVMKKLKTTRNVANAQRNGRPAEHRWRPLFNATKFGWRPLLDCRAVTLPRRESHWNLQGCPKLVNRPQPLVGRSSPYCGDMWRTYRCLTSFFRLSIHALVAKI